jgi:neutral trehalase
MCYNYYVNKKDFPKVRFYDQDFVDIYDKTWTWIQEFFFDPKTVTRSSDGCFLYHDQDIADGPKRGAQVNYPFHVDQMEAIFSTFFLVYSNRHFTPSEDLDFIYARQEPSGAIRWRYDARTRQPIFTQDNPQGVGLPMFAWA